MNEKINILASVILSLFYGGIILLVLLIQFEVWSAPQNTSLILIIIGLSSAVIFGIVYLVLFLLKKRKEKVEQSQKEQLQQTLEEQREQARLEEPHNNTSIRTKQKQYQEIEISRILLFKGKIKKNSKCGICKLTIRIEQEIYQCPNCRNLFHSQHLKEWFQNEQNCPICNHSLKDYIIFK